MPACRSSRFSTPRFVLVMLIAAVAIVSDVYAQAVDDRSLLLAIHQASLKTQARLKTNAASWTCALQLRTGPRVFVSVLKTPAQQRYILAAAARRQPDEISRLIVRDGVWYVTEGYNRRAYRPYEANFKLPETYYYLLRSDFQQVREAPNLAGLTVDSIDADVVTVREMPSELALQRTRRSINELEAIIAREPDAQKKGEYMKEIANAERLLKSGVTSKFSQATGMMLEDLYSRCTYELRDFKWLDSVDANEFDVKPEEFEDYTGPRSADSNQHVMISYLMPAPESLKTRDVQRQAEVLDLATGKITRVPFHDYLSQPGCFLKDRSRVIVFGVSRTNQGFSPFEVNLRTGTNRPVGGKELTSGMCFAAALSPDGKTVAILHNSDPSLGNREWQVKLVDLANDHVRAIGKPMRYRSMAWLPDGTGLLLSHDTPNQEDKSTIGRMDLQGAMTPLFSGDWPVVLPTLNRILHEARPLAWMTRALDGTDPQPYLGGMPGHYLPAISPDGTKLLFMRFNGSDPPQPYIYRLGEITGKPASGETGVWEQPIWR